MKTSLLLRLSGALLALASFTTFAENGGVPPPRPVVYHGGLQVTLSTGGYKFLVDPAPGPTAGVGAILPGEPIPGPVPSRDSFPASALLTNRSNSDITFTFPNPVAAETHFTFRVLDSSGGEVWSSEDDVIAPQVMTEARLARRSSWRRLVQVPLRIEGRPLAPGFYTLQAVIEADKEVAATAIFEVALRTPLPPDPTLTGIKGLVVRATGVPPGSASILPVDRPVGGARVVVSELRDNDTLVAGAAFYWEGQTNAEGRFTAQTPPGRFKVTVTVFSPVTSGPGVPAVVDGADALTSVATVTIRGAEVTVEQGRFSDVTIRFPATETPPVAESGIRGLVLIGPIRPVETIGQANEAPLAGALVRIEEIRLPNARYDRPAFTWSGVTNAQGRFQVRTPPGRFRVIASQRLVVANPLVSGFLLVSNDVTRPVGYTSAEVTVEQGRFSEVTLHLDTGIR